MFLDITFLESIEVSLISVGIVFSILYLLTVIVSFVSKQLKEKIIPLPNPISVPFSIEDIKDEDMMVAALVASIDYQNETQGDVVVTSIKEITR
jgi:glutaconyl-CoA/methylmalonyl-CoA decarboxylase subunit delta